MKYSINQKRKFCSDLSNLIHSCTEFIQSQHDIFYDGVKEDNFNEQPLPYYPPKTSENLALGNIFTSLLCASNQVDYLHQYLIHIQS